MICGNKDCRNTDDKQFTIQCTKAGMFVSYFTITCKVCGYTKEDRWQDSF
jgi:hypothetical protein